MTLARSAFTVASLVFVAACSDVWVLEPGFGQNYYEGAFEYAAKDGSVNAVVLGSPYPGAGEGVPALTAATMKGATRGAEVDFMPVAWTEPDNAYRVVVVFNGRAPFVAEDLCRNAPGVGTVDAPARTTMDIAFCQGNHLISSARGYTAPLTGSQDPRYRRLVREVALAMIPVADLNRIGDGDPVTP